MHSPSRISVYVPLYFLGVLFVLTTLCATQAAAVTEMVLHSFSAQQHGYWPTGLVADSSGNFYGTAQYGGTYNNGVVFKFAPKAGGGWTQTVIYTFLGGADGEVPTDPMPDTAGNIYGVTPYGSPGGCNGSCGSIFELTLGANGWIKSTIYVVPKSVGHPTGALLPDGAGNLYGATNDGSGSCSIFKLTPAGGGSWTATTVYSFSGGTYTAQIAGLVFDESGNLYGAVSNTGSATQGLVVELTPSGESWTEKVLYTFGGGTTGGVPTGPLLLQQGNLYGATLDGGLAQCDGLTDGCGVIFELKPGSNGQWSEKVLYTLGADGNNGPIDPALSAFDSSGNLYGFTNQGGAGVCNYCGSVFELVPSGNGSWKERDLWDFTGAKDGDYPTAAVLGTGGQIYGTTSGGVNEGSIFELAPKGSPSGSWALTSLYGFPFTDGSEPSSSGLVADGGGNLYGTTRYGGLNNVGSIFEMAPAGKGWKEKMIYSFGPKVTGSNFTASPSGLILDTKGNLYGSAGFGGANQAGSVFELSPVAGGAWQEKDLVSFATTSGPRQPVGGVVFDKAGNLYGTTLLGGAHGLGTVFELTPNGGGEWTEQTIYSFSGGDGAKPQAGLTIDGAGNLYGTTELGGSGTCHDQTGGCGTVFELSYASNTGWTETVLYSFLGVPGNDGAAPQASLILDGSGNIYGTTTNGGNKPCSLLIAGCGTVFELSPSGGGWTETLLHEFVPGGPDGVIPYGGLILDQSGNLYGTTGDGGAYTSGTIFELSPSAGGGWTESVIYSFGNGSDGKVPQSTLIFDAAGDLYGTTFVGGIGGGSVNSGEGTVFEITP